MGWGGVDKVGRWVGGMQKGGWDQVGMVGWSQAGCDKVGMGGSWASGAKRKCVKIRCFELGGDVVG